MITPTFTVIIPVRAYNDFLKQTLYHIKHQSFRSFEILVITDKLSKSSNPAAKRNLGAKMARGTYLAFLDDDSYPHRHWLKNAYNQFKQNSYLAAACGPCLTPPEDNINRQASGLFWSSFLGSGAAGTYRNSIASPRFVDDYPSVNLIVKKTDFDSVKGFNTHHWPGEDTILCLNITHKLNKKILYHPSIIVYHHRREVLLPHLKQISRYALHRGNFARIYPQTSFRINYFLPSIFMIYCLILLIFHHFIFFIPLLIYIVLLLFSFFQFLLQTKNFYLSLISTLTIPISHIYYGFLFIIGFFSRSLNFSPHHTDHNGNYLGG